MVLAGVECAINGDAADLMIGWDPVEQLWQHRRIAYLDVRCRSVPKILLTPPALRTCFWLIEALLGMEVFGAPCICAGQIGAG
jgi:hypothetical protein